VEGAKTSKVAGGGGKKGRSVGVGVSRWGPGLGCLEFQTTADLAPPATSTLILCLL